MSADQPAQPQAKTDLDSEALRRVAAGDENAIASVMLRHRGAIHGFLMTKAGRLLSESDIEEIVQDTFLAAVRAVGSFRGDSTVKTWLWRIAYNRALNKIGYNKRRRADVTGSLDQPIGDNDDGRTVADVIADSADVTGAVEESETEKKTHVAMQRLSSAEREIIEMRGVQHLSYEEISERLGVNIGTVKSRLARARKALKLRVSRANRGFYRTSRLAKLDQLIADGLTGREIRRRLGVHSTTVAKRRRFLETRDGKIAACACGQPVTHRGWCSHRFRASASRQQFMARWRRV